MTLNRDTSAALPVPAPPSVEPPMQLEMISAYCNSAGCPTIYRSDRGTLVVQGYTVPAGRAGVDVPAGETLVEIPVEVLLAAARAVG